MRVCTTMIVGAAAAVTCATAFAQNRTSPAFTATGTSCSQVTWSRESLALYPRIANACEEVMQRDGRYYVRFSGDVQRVADRGRSVTIDFRDGDRLTLTPPENMSLFINGRRTPVTELRVGDELRFYVPQDSLAANFFESEAPTAQAQVVPIAPPAPAEPGLLAQNQPAPGARLPRTASPLPLVGVVALALLAFGGALTVRRWSAESR
jgi:hypothetical protein